MIFMHEVHEVAGKCEDEFEAAYRKGWMEALAGTADARLLWFFRQAHGTGPAYRFVTVTGLAGAAAWQTLVTRIMEGDLVEWAASVDGMRHGCSAKLLVPVPWSPLEEVDLASVPVDGSEHEPTLYMEDTAWPYPGGHAAYLAKAGDLYARTLTRSAEQGRAILEMEAAFHPLPGTAAPNEVVLWQKVVNHRALLHLLSHEVPEEQRGPGSWMQDALAVRDRWESRLLRTAPWSPRC